MFWVNSYMCAKKYALLANSFFSYTFSKTKAVLKDSLKQFVWTRNLEMD